MDTIDCPTCKGKGTVRTASKAEMQAVRKAAGLSQRALARRLGVSDAYVCQIERRPGVVPSADLENRWLEVCAPGLMTEPERDAEYARERARAAAADAASAAEASR